MGVPFDVKDVINAGGKLLEERGAVVRVAVFVDPTASDALIEAVRAAFTPETVQGRIHVEVVADGTVVEVEPTSDIVVVVAGVAASVAGIVEKSAAHAIPVVVLSQVDAPIPGVPTANLIHDPEPSDLVAKLGDWLVDHAEKHRLPLAANFLFMRHAVALESVRATAFQNAVVGGLLFIPGADMPVMTANQAKMLLQIAAAYGQPLGKERIKELAAVVGGAFAFRTAARQIVGLVPGLGWAIKAGIGYSGTLAMGHAAIEYFENGGDMKGLAQRAVAARDSVIKKSRGLTSRRTERTAVADDQTAAPRYLTSVAPTDDSATLSEGQERQ